MPEVLLTLHCASVDTDNIMVAMRSTTRAPLHARVETVHGRDFGDAQPFEQVTATLKRTTIECIEDDATVPAILAAVGAAKRQSPLRWHLTPIAARGRIA